MAVEFLYRWNFLKYVMKNWLVFEVCFSIIYSFNFSSMQRKMTKFTSKVHAMHNGRGVLVTSTKKVKKFVGAIQSLTKYWKGKKKTYWKVARKETKKWTAFSEWLPLLGLPIKHIHVKIFKKYEVLFYGMEHPTIF